MSASQRMFCISQALSHWRFRRPKRTALAVRIFTLVSLFILLLAPAVWTQSMSYPLDINVMGTSIENQRTLAPQGGWQLTIELSARHAEGLLTYNGLAPYPDQPLPLSEINSIQSHAVGFVLFSNPDGVAPGLNSMYPPESYCLSFLNDYFGTDDSADYQDSLLSTLNHGQCPAVLPPDEKYLYFQIGSDIGADEISWPAFSQDGGNNPSEEPDPARGRSPRIPGLVILSDSGIGNVYDGPFPIPGPLPDNNSYFLTSPKRQARNLAAYINSVSYLMRNYRDKTVITASWIAPRNIVSPYIERDSNYGGSCVGGDSGTDQTAILVNGSKDIQLVTMPSGASLDEFLRDFVVNLRVFVVNGFAPLSLEDRNGDAQVDSRDAEILGYQLLSPEKVILVRTAFWEFFGNRVDLDGNGCAGPAYSPAGAGGLGRIPQ